MSFQKYKVSDFSTVVAGGTPSTSNNEYWDGEIPWITPKDLSNHNERYIEYGERNITALGLKKSSAKIVPENTVLLTTRAPVGYVALAKNEVCTNQGFKNLICDETIAYPQFVYYMLKKNKELLENHATGATFKELSGSRLKEIEFPLPPLPTQKRIADILSTYDDLIENNNRRISLLEQSARHLYKEWFVRFKFPGHEKVKVVDGVPEGWERKTLGEVCDDKRQSILPDQIEPGTPYIGLEHIPKRQMVLNEWGNSDSISSMKFVYLKGDILFGKIRPYFHKVGFTFNNGVTSSDAIVICPSEPIYYSFVLCLVSSDEFVKLATQTMKEGSKMPRADWKSLKRDHIVPVPKAGLLNAFNHFIEPTLKQLETISLENVQLKATRDILLPKLLNGNMVT